VRASDARSKGMSERYEIQLGGTRLSYLVDTNDVQDNGAEFVISELLSIAQFGLDRKAA
jgi:hypothetical protein